MFNVLLSCVHAFHLFFFPFPLHGHHTPKPKPTPTVTPVVTMTVTPTIDPSITPTATPSPTLTLTPTASPTPTLSLTPTATATPTLSLTPTPTATPTPTISLTPTASPSPTLTPTPTITRLGNDISYPQCGKTLPTGQGFGIVGINGGIASTSNPCLTTQLQWANQSLGTTNQAKIQLYVNTGNPGGLNTATWPDDNTDPEGNVSNNPYGTCDSSDSMACAWQYGWNRAVDDVVSRFAPAAAAVSLSTTPSDYPWWLDVESVNSWKDPGEPKFDENRAVLEGMVSYFTSRGITVGVYSTNFQWGQIVGTVPAGSNLNGLRNWRPGAIDLSSAMDNCSLSPLTTGASVIMTQYTADNFDYDYSCL